MKLNHMNKLIKTLVLCSVAVAEICLAQDQPPGNPQAQSIPSEEILKARHASQQPALQKFDLNFRGGSPRDLVNAIEEATAKPMNVLIQKEDETVQMPAMKFKSVTIPDLFAALMMASQKPDNTYYTFDTQGHGDNAIYYFKCNKPRTPQEFCRFYQLGEDLKNYSIEDITTAIQTGWKMLGVKTEPMLKFHRETKLLIAVGPPEQLRIIDDALRELRTAPPQKAADKKDAAPAK
jgi:hypothetical protein